MSSRHSKRKRGGLRDPAPWGEWMWSDEHQRHYRSRLKGPGDWEFEYDQPEDRPRTFTPFEPADLEAPPPSPYPSSNDYTAAHDEEIDDVTQGVSQATLEERGPKESWRGSSETYPSITSSGSYYSAATYPSTGAYSAYYPSPSPVWQPHGPHLTTKDPLTHHEDFDPHYKVHRASDFKWGKIFKVLWVEPKGAEGADSAEQSGTESVTVRRSLGGKDTFAKVRRFVIIKPMDGHCICLPILTYSGQGVNKRGVNAGHHAIIFSGKRQVVLRGEKEKGLTMRAIKVTPDNPRHKLNDASRLNYAKTYTVEYNVKVWFIGKVSRDSEWQIRSDYNRIHPVLDIKGFPAHETPDDTYGSSAATTNYALGGGSDNTGYYDSGSSDAHRTSYDDPVHSSGSSYPGAPPYSSSGSSYDRQEYHSGGYELQGPVNGMDHGGYSSNGYAEHSSQRKKGPKGKYRGEPEYFEEPPETDGIPEEPEEPFGGDGDPLHDGDSDDNGDQGDQDRGGGQRRCERYSRDSRRRR